MTTQHRKQSAQERSHSPLPWHIVPDKWRSMITDNPSEPFQAIAEVFHTEVGSQWLCEGGEGKANAQFIITACNSHAALVGALEACLDPMLSAKSNLGIYAKHETANINSLKAALEQARAALNLAKGGK